MSDKKDKTIEEKENTSKDDFFGKEELINDFPEDFFKKRYE